MCRMVREINRMSRALRFPLGISGYGKDDIAFWAIELRSARNLFFAAIVNAIGANAVDYITIAYFPISNFFIVKRIGGNFRQEFWRQFAERVWQTLLNNLITFNSQCRLNQPFLSNSFSVPFNTL